MAMSARALEIFNTLYSQFGWVILTKFFFLGGRCVCGGGEASTITWAHYICRLICFLPFLLFCHSSCLCFSFSLCHRWTDQSRWSQQTVRAGEVLYAFPCFFYFPPCLTTFLLLFQPYKHAVCAYQAHHYVSYLTMPCSSTQADSTASSIQNTLC